MSSSSKSSTDERQSTKWLQAIDAIPDWFDGRKAPGTGMIGQQVALTVVGVYLVKTIARQPTIRAIEESQFSIVVPKGAVIEAFGAAGDFFIRNCIKLTPGRSKGQLIQLSVTGKDRKVRVTVYQGGTADYTVNDEGEYRIRIPVPALPDLPDFNNKGGARRRPVVGKKKPVAA